MSLGTSPAPDFGRLDDLLSRWHWWQMNGGVGRGFNRRSLVAGEYLSSGQYDAENGVQDQVMDEGTARAIDAEVADMPEPHRTAVYVLARNLCTGWEVWRSPRLPAEAAELDRVVEQARSVLAMRLVAAGVL